MICSGETYIKTLRKEEVSATVNDKRWTEVNLDKRDQSHQYVYKAVSLFRLYLQTQFGDFASAGVETRVTVYMRGRCSQPAVLHICWMSNDYNFSEGRQ